MLVINCLLLNYWTVNCEFYNKFIHHAVEREKVTFPSKNGHCTMAVTI